MQRERIVVIDCGSQYAHLIARRVRDLEVFSDITLPEEFSAERLGSDVKGVIISGGPASVYAEGAPKEFLEKVAEELERQLKPDLSGVAMVLSNKPPMTIEPK